MSLNERNMGPLLLAIPRPLSSFLLCFLIFFFLFLWLHLLLFFFFSFINAIIIMVSKFCYSPVQEFIFTYAWQFNSISLIFFRWISFVILFHGIKSYAKTDSLINGTNCCPRNRVTCDNIWSPCHCTTKK